MYRILLTGTYNSMNKGDAAIKISTARALKAVLDDADIVISSPFPEIDRDFYFPFRVVKCNRRRLIWATFQLVRAYIWGLVNKHLKYDLRFMVPDDEIQTFMQSDLVVDLSGDMVTEDYGPHVAYSHFVPILMALFLHKPVFLCAQSIGPFSLTRPVAKYLLNAVDLISVRDDITMRYLKEIGIKNNSIVMTADMAFLLEPASAERVDSILGDEGIDIGVTDVLGVSLSQLVEKKYQKRNPLSRDMRFVELFAGILDNISSELGLRIVLVPHVTGPSKAKDDRIIIRKIRDGMKEKAYVVEGDYSPEELKGIIGRCTIFLGARMHANIAALSQGVPVAAISYSHKSPGIMDLFGQKQYVCPIESLNAEDIYEHIKSLYENRNAIPGVLTQKMEHIRRGLSKNIELVVEILNRDSNDMSHAGGIHGKME